MAGVKVETAPAQNGLKEGGTPGHNRPNRPNKFSPGGNQGQNRFNQQRKKDDQVRMPLISLPICLLFFCQGSSHVSSTSGHLLLDHILCTANLP